MDAGTVESVLALPYLPVWRKVFSPQRPPVLLRQMVADMRTKAGGELPPGAALCFRGAPCHDAGPTPVGMYCGARSPGSTRRLQARLAFPCWLRQRSTRPPSEAHNLPHPPTADAFFSVHGGISILSRSIRGPTPCVNSTFIRAMAHFITDGLQLTAVQPPSRADGSGAEQANLRVVWALRSNRAERQSEVLDLLRQRLPEQGAEVRGLLAERTCWPVVLHACQVDIILTHPACAPFAASCR